MPVAVRISLYSDMRIIACMFDLSWQGRARSRRYRASRDEKCQVAEAGSGTCFEGVRPGWNRLVLS